MKATDADRTLAAQLIEHKLTVEWQQKALCAQTDAETFFPKKGQYPARAKAICERCEVKTDCLATAVLSKHNHFGVWGGLTERERRLIREGARDIKKSQGLPFGKRRVRVHERQQRVLELNQKGTSVRQIAAELDVSTRTVMRDLRSLEQQAQPLAS